MKRSVDFFENVPSVPIPESVPPTFVEPSPGVDGQAGRGRKKTKKTDSFEHKKDKKETSTP